MAQVAISADFLTAFTRLPHSQQKKVDNFITQFRYHSTAASIHLEPIHDVRDDRIRTARIDLAYRAVLLQPRKGDVFVLLWVDHHDEAMAWARNRIFEINPVTGAIQIVETQAVDAAQQAIARMQRTAAASPATTQMDDSLYGTFDDEALLRTGLPRLLLPAVRALHTPEDLDAIEHFLPAETYEALYWITNLGYAVDQAIAETTGLGREEQATPVDTEDVAAALAHPDSKRRFVLVDSDEELTKMLAAPLEKWRVFLHPSQAKLVRKHFNGPARVLAGPAPARRSWRCIGRAILPRKSSLLPPTGSCSRPTPRTWPTILAGTGQSVRGGGGADRGRKPP